MKKVYLFLMMMCTLCAFTGCTDDDDETPQNPVTGVVLPKQAQKAGSEFQIAGNGFSSTCEIYLVAKEPFKAEVTERLASALTVKIPASLTPGQYTVLLRQAGDWILGTLNVLEADVPCPVSEVVVPEGEIEAGTEVTIAGSGFAADAELYLKLGEDSTKMTVTVAQDGISFTLPEDLAAGEYAVVLKQNGVWALGKIVVVAKVVPASSIVSKITRVYYNKKGEEKKYFYDFTYDETTGKLLKIEESDLLGNMQYEKFEWNGTQLTVSVYFPNLEGNYTDEVSDTYIYTLNDKGLVIKGESNTMYGAGTSAWSYDAAGKYLLKIGYGENDANGTAGFTMDGNKLKTFSYSSYQMNVDFSYQGENAAPENKADLDMMPIIMENGMYLRDFELFYALWAGICGEKPAYLPLNVKDEVSEINQDCIYATNSNGYVTEITLPDGSEHPVKYLVDYK